MQVAMAAAAPRRLLLIGVVLAVGFLGALVMSQAHADAAQPAQFACVRLSNGEMRHVADPGQCTKNETPVSLHGTTPLYVCVKNANQSMRLAAGPNACASGKETLVVLNDAQTVYACAQAGQGQLALASGPAGCSGDDVTIQIPPGAPAATADAYNATSAAPLVVTAADGVLANDTGGELTAHIGDTSQLVGTVALAADGGFTYTPPASLPSSPLTTAFTYTASNNGGSSGATVTITVYSAPVANDDSYLPLAGQPFSVPAPGVLANDAANGATLTAFDATGSAGGGLALAADGGFTYTPTAGFSGVETFHYTLGNLAGADSATITFQVGSPPAAADDAAAATGNVPIDTNGLLSVLDNDQANGATLSGPSVSAQGGTVQLRPDGTFTYTPPTGYRGDDSFQYTLTNGLGTTHGTVHLTVANMVWFVNNAAPAGGDGALPTPYDSLAALSAAAADQPGDVIFVYTSATPYADGLTLQDDQALLGQGADLTTAAGFPFALGSVGLPTATIGAAPTLANPAGAAVTLGHDNALRGFVVGDTSGAGISGAGFGTLTVTGVSVTGQGQALDLRDGALDALFDGVASAGSAAEGARLENLTGALTITGALTVSNPGGAALALVNDAGLTTGIGAVALSATGQPGLSATMAGALTISAGTIAVSGAPAVDIDGGALTISLASVSATGGQTGLRLANTSGSFAVTGTPGVDGSGGALSGQSSDGARIENAANVTLANMQISGVATADGATCSAADNSDCAAGVDLDGATGATLDNVDISGSGQIGVNARGADGLTITGSSITNSGDEPGESGLLLVNLTGAATIADTQVSGSADANAVVANANGALALHVSNSTFSDTGAAGSHGLALSTTGSGALTADITGATFERNRLSGIAVDASGGSLDVTVDGATLTTNNLGIDLQASGVAALSFDIASSSFSGHGSSLINVFTPAGPQDAPSVSGSIVGNTLTGTAGANAFGVRVDHNSPSQMTLLVDDNSITGIDHPNGIAARAHEQGHLDLTVTNNTVRVVNAASPASHGIVVEALDHSAVCLNLSGNDSAAANVASQGYRLRVRDGATFALQGFAGDGTSAAAVVAFVQGQNTGSASASVGAGMQFTSGVCLTP